MKRRNRELATVLALAAVYFLAGKFGLSLAFVHPSSTAVWPPTGIAFAAILILGYRVWPGVFLGAFLVNLTTMGTVATSLGIATGNTLEALVGAYLIHRFANGLKVFERAQDILKFAVLAGMVSTAVAATIGVTTLSLGHFADWHEYKSVWLTWWLGDCVGDLIVAPVLILWHFDRSIRWGTARLSEAVVLLVGLVVVGQIIFCGFFLTPESSYPIEYLCIPFLLWAALRYGQRETATATMILAGIAVWGTFQGLGPFVRGSVNESLLLLQSFMGVVAVMALSLACVSSERQRAEEEARRLAVTDPLTGLANYRRLIDAIDAEIRRYERTERPFSILILDLDGLKKINDLHGHIVGSRALCRLAGVLRIHCRGTDTAARYGGDEFAVVMPESGVDAAQRLLRRIHERVAEETEDPPLSVSVGSAVYPYDGDTVETLLAYADRELYTMKRRRPIESATVPPPARFAN